MEMYGVAVELHVEVAGELHVPAALPPREEPAVSIVFWIGCRVSQRAGMIAVEKRNIFASAGIPTPIARSCGSWCSHCTN
jgi:hypothetical protein